VWAGQEATGLAVVGIPAVLETQGYSFQFADDILTRGDQKENCLGEDWSNPELFRVI